MLATTRVVTPTLAPETVIGGVIALGAMIQTKAPSLDGESWQRKKEFASASPRTYAAMAAPSSISVFTVSPLLTAWWIVKGIQPGLATIKVDYQQQPFSIPLRLKEWKPHMHV